MISTSMLHNPGITIPIGDGFTIYYYAIIIVFGIIMATVVAALLFKHRNIPSDWILDMLICVLPLGIIGARTFYCATDPSTSMSEWLSGFRDGGLSIIGGVIGGALGVVVFCLWHKVNFFRIADCVAPGVVLAQSIGRWGNFVNQEVYGGLITDPAWQWFPFGVQLDNGEWHYAFFFYESVCSLIIFALLFAFMWKFNKKPSGLSLCGYLFGYGMVRSIMEPFRDSEFILGSSVPVSQVFAIIMAVSGVVLFAALLIWNKKRYGSVIGAAQGEPLATLPKLYTKELLKKAEEERLAKERAIKLAAQSAEQNADEQELREKEADQDTEEKK